jgi:hypothetical protein
VQTVHTSEKSFPPRFLKFPKPLRSIESVRLGAAPTLTAVDLLNPLYGWIAGIHCATSKQL